jgi:hypothetical protein
MTDPTKAAEAIIEAVRYHKGHLETFDKYADIVARDLLKTKADLEWRTTERQAAKFTAAGYKNERDRMAELLEKLLDATLESKCCTACKVEGHDGCAAGWPSVQAAREALAAHEKAKLAWLSDPNDGVGEPDPMAGP